MKKGIFLLASVAMLMFAGCGESSGGATSIAPSSGSNGSGSSTNTSNGNTAASSGNTAASNGDVSNTSVTNEFGLNPELGTPPQLPAS